MADPRIKPPSSRHDPLSALQKAKRGAEKGEVVNFCPFACGDHELDELGYCAHLVGFTEDGQIMEPRVRRGDGRIYTAGGKARRPVKVGDRLVKVSTCSRVYRKTPDPSLIPPQAREDMEPAGLYDDRARRAQAVVDRIMNPVMEGEVTERTVYDDSPDDPGEWDEEADARAEAELKRKSDAERAAKEQADAQKAAKASGPKAPAKPPASDATKTPAG